MRLILVLLLTVVISGCSKPDLTQYAENDPTFDIFEYFSGETTGWGIVQNRSGELIRQFVVEIDGTVDEAGNLVLNEDFTWSDGEESVRVWTISRSGDGQYTGIAGDVVGEAVGRSSGNVLHWQYYLDIDVDGSTWKVHLDDWMYLHRDEVLINRSAMSKFGIHLGDITITFSKQPRREGQG